MTHSFLVSLRYALESIGGGVCERENKNGSVRERKGERKLKEHTETG